MKTKDLKELKTRDIKDLKVRVQDLEKQKTVGLIELKMAKVKNVHSISKIKKEIAQIKTLINLKLISKKERPDNKEKNATD